MWLETVLRFSFHSMKNKAERNVREEIIPDKISSTAAAQSRLAMFLVLKIIYCENNNINTTCMTVLNDPKTSKFLSCMI